MNSMVYALTVYNGNLIAGGWFTTAGGKVSAYLAEWTKVDVDGDGYADDVDCDDNDPYTYPGAAPNDNPTACMRDIDEDDYGDITATGDIVAGTDCDDADGTIYPGATEIWYDGIDQDCNGIDAITCIVDADQDGYGNDQDITVIALDGSCDLADSESDNMTDCNDGVASIHPGATEIPDDDVDQDCNGIDAITCIVDADQDGYGNDQDITVIALDGSCDLADSESDNMTDCNDGVASIHPGATEIPDDDVDQDCNGFDEITCFVDSDLDGYGTDLGTSLLAPDGSCDAAQGESDNMEDCDDSEGSINPGETEIPGDGIDQDCDGVDPCCIGRVGDANNSGDDEPTIGDVAELVDHLFIDKPPLVCVAEADVNQSGGIDPSQVLPDSDITIGDIAELVNYLFIATPAFGELPDCL